MSKFDIITHCNDCSQKYYNGIQMYCKKTNIAIYSDKPIPKNCPLQDDKKFQILEKNIKTQEYINIFNVINKINDELIWDKANNIVHYGDFIDENNYTLNLKTNGKFFVIYFGDFVLWSSECDCREWIEKTKKYEPLEKFLKREIQTNVGNYVKYIYSAIKKWKEV